MAGFGTIMRGTGRLLWSGLTASTLTTCGFVAGIAESEEVKADSSYSISRPYRESSFKTDKSEKSIELVRIYHLSYSGSFWLQYLHKDYFRLLSDPDLHNSFDQIINYSGDTIPLHDIKGPEFIKTCEGYDFKLNEIVTDPQLSEGERSVLLHRDSYLIHAWLYYHAQTAEAEAETAAMKNRQAQAAQATPPPEPAADSNEVNRTFPKEVGIAAMDMIMDQHRDVIRTSRQWDDYQLQRNGSIALLGFLLMFGASSIDRWRLYRYNGLSTLLWLAGMVLPVVGGYQAVKDADAVKRTHETTAAGSCAAVFSQEGLQEIQNKLEQQSKDPEARRQRRFDRYWGGIPLGDYDPLVRQLYSYLPSSR